MQRGHHQQSTERSLGDSIGWALLALEINVDLLDARMRMENRWSLIGVSWIAPATTSSNSDSDFGANLRGKTNIISTNDAHCALRSVAREQRSV
jgi:hypothetical protein